MHGVVYLGSFGKRGVQIMYNDVDSESAETFRIFEQAIATFRLSETKPAAKP
jgi:hypothetical protein